MRCILQQDNAPPHTAKSTREYIAEQQVFDVVPDWPPRSPDLNVIENLWGYLAGKLLLWVAPNKTLDTLQVEVHRLLELPDTKDFILKLLGSFRGRLEKCVKAKGEWTGH